MRFIGTVVFTRRQDHVRPTELDQSAGSVAVTDVALEGCMCGQVVWIEITVPTRQARAYTIGRRVVVTVKTT